ncbi:MAG: hypothetical protein K2J77_04755 [Oscillospiraceae bacterium]|nr:hypothetical protein [Oscillospiraceae bacterium]
MGKFFTALHVKADSRDGFVNAFEQLMKKDGYVPCPEDEAAVSYAAAFSEGGWVTLSNGDDSVGELTKLSAKIARDMKTSCFTVEAVDSDFAILELHAPSGRTSRVVVGDGEGYGVEKAPILIDDWRPLFQNGGVEEFIAVIGQNSTFVEDDLAEIGGLLGISSYAMTADYDELSGNGGVLELSFKKAAEKKLTLNAAFVKVFGEGLEPLGFKRLKNLENKYPYFVRVVNGDILHAVSYRQTTSPKTGYKEFEVCCGVVTLYRRKINFTVEPQMLLTNTSHLYSYAVEGGKIDPSVKKPQSYYLCNATDSEEMLRKLEIVFNDTMGILLNYIDKITDLDACVEYFYNTERGIMHLYPFDEFITSRYTSKSEALLLVKTRNMDDGVERLKNIYKDSDFSFLGPRATQEDIEKYLKKREDFRAQQYAYRLEMINDPELNKRVLAEMERCKANNIELLKSYGVIID